MEQNQDAGGIDFHKVFQIIWNRKWIVMGIALSLGAVTGIYNKFFIPSYYNSVSWIMPQTPAGGGGQPSLQSVLGASSSNPLGKLVGLGESSGELSQYDHLLKSRRLAAAVLERIGLEQIATKGGPSDPDEAVMARALAKLQTGIKVTIDGEALKIEYVDPIPQRAATIIQAYLDSLQTFIQKNSNTQARAAENFIRERLGEATKSLAAFEVSFVALQKKTGIIELPAQASLALNTAAQLRAQLIEKDIEIDLNRSIVKDESQIKRLQIERSQIAMHLNRLLQNESPGHNARTKTDLLKPLGALPNLEVEFAQAKREYMIQSKVVDLLRQQLEMAQIETKRNEPSFQVIDPPDVPYFRAGPNTRLNTMIATIFGGILGIIFVLLLHKWREMQAISRIAIRAAQGDYRPEPPNKEPRIYS